LISLEPGLVNLSRCFIWARSRFRASGNLRVWSRI